MCGCMLVCLNARVFASRAACVYACKSILAVCLPGLMPVCVYIWVYIACNVVVPPPCLDVGDIQYVCLYVCMPVYMSACMVFVYVCCRYDCLFVCAYVCMDVCM